MQKQQRIFEPSLFRQYLRSKMISLLDSIAGKKLLMLDLAVRIPINLTIERKILSEHGIPEEGGILPFDPIVIPNNFDQIMIFLTPSSENLKKLKELILQNAQKGNKKYYPCFWPKRTVICREYFEQERLAEFIDIRDFSFDLLPLDVDLYSLEIKFVKQLYVNHNHSIYATVAESIHRLQCVFGKIHNIYGKGKAAKAITDILQLKENQIKIDQNYGDIESVIIIDRSIDFLTPLLKQITFEGLIDELYGINGGVTKVAAGLFDDANKPKDKKTENAYKVFKMNSEKDYIYEQVRSLSIMGARQVIKIRGAEHDRFQEEAALLKDMNEKSAALKKINMQKQFLKLNLELVTVALEEIKSISFNKELLMQQKCLLDKQKQIIEYNENMIPFELPLQKILRSMCLQCIIDKGVNKKIYGRICEDICLTYGIQHVVSLTHLANLGLFYEQGSIKQPYQFADIKKEMKLISQAEIDHANPQDTSFAYGGYTPIASRLVEHAIRNGWRLLAKALKLIPGETIIPQFTKTCSSHPKPAVVVYFVGGVTYGEIATIRLLGKFLKRQIIIATTQVINGQSLIRQLIEP